MTTITHEEVINDDGEMDNVEGWTDERTRLSEEERLTLAESVEPVAKVLVKVSEKRYQDQTNSSMFSHQLRKIASSTLHLTTKRLPHWFDILKRLKLDKKTLPRDVRTQWNSTFKMLNSANEYRVAIDSLTSNRAMGMRKCELTKARSLGLLRSYETSSM